MKATLTVPPTLRTTISTSAPLPTALIAVVGWGEMGADLAEHSAAVLESTGATK